MDKDTVERIMSYLLSKIDVCKKYQAGLPEREGKEWFNGKIVAYQEVYDMLKRNR